VELRRIGLPLVSPFRTSASGVDSRDVLLVRVITPEAEGWGECAAMNEPLYSPEYTEDAHAVVREHLVPRLLQQPDVEATEVEPRLAPVKGHLMAKAAVESAVLDAELRAAGLPLATYLGATTGAVAVGVSVGLTPSVGQLITAVENYVAEGYQRSSSRSSRVGTSVRLPRSGGSSPISPSRSMPTRPTRWPTRATWPTWTSSTWS